MQKKIKEQEGAEPPQLAAIPARVEIYAELAKRFRAAHGYTNYVLANTLEILSLLHILRFYHADPGNAQICAAMLQTLDVPALCAQTFEEVYRASLDTTVELDSTTPQARIATMKRLGDYERFGLLPRELRSINTSALLTRADPAGLLGRLSLAEMLARGALAPQIQFGLEGGRMEDYGKVRPLDVMPRVYGVLEADLESVRGLLADNDPDSTLLTVALDGPRRAARSRFQVNERPIGRVDGFNQSSYGMWFSPDNRRFHTIAIRGGKQVIYTERGESRAYDSVWLESFLYSLQSTSFAFVGKTGEREVVVLDGVEGRAYDRISNRFERRLHFSADGRHLAYVGTRGQQDFLVLDRREIGSFDVVQALTFAPDHRLAYAACRSGKCTVVYGPLRSKEYDSVGRGITFSPDGKTWAYQATLKGQHYNIAEGAGSFSYCCGNSPGGSGPIFSPDGRRILFSAEGGDQQLVDLDVKANSRTQYFHGAAKFFAPDLRSWATVEVLNPGASTQACTVAIGDRQWRIDTGARCIVDFTPDGRHFVIRADSQNTRIDGNAIPSAHRLDKELSRPVEFSPDGSSYAYEATMMPGGQRSFIVRDGKEIQSFKSAVRFNGVSFSPDSRHIAYVVPHGPLNAAIAVDGEEALAVYDFVPYQSRIVFDSPQKLHTVAVRNGEVLLVELSWRD